MNRLIIITILAIRALFLSAPANADNLSPPPIINKAINTANINAGQRKASLCMGCHNIPGYRTAFPEIYRVPKLNGQNAKYIETALQEYKEGTRKFSTMHAIAASLSDQDIADIAAYYADATSCQSEKQKPTRQPKPKPTPAANTNNQGKELIERNLCIACHGAHLNEPVSPDYPKLAGQHSDYLYYAMRAYQIDKPMVGRNHPVMQAQLQNLSQQDLRDIAQYIELLPGDLSATAKR